MQTLGEKIALVIKARGWQQKEFAASIGYTAEHLSRLLKHDVLPNKALRNIAKGLDLLPEDLLHLPDMGRGHMPTILSEPGARYGDRATAQNPDSDDQLDFFKQEIARLHEELARVNETLAREQGVNASLAEALKNLTAGK